MLIKAIIDYYVLLTIFFQSLFACIYERSDKSYEYVCTCQNSTSFAHTNTLPTIILYNAIDITTDQISSPVYRK